MIVLLNLAINMSSMKHLWGVISRITQPATYESINDEGVISLNRDRLQSKEITYIYIYIPPMINNRGSTVMAWKVYTTSCPILLGYPIVLCSHYMPIISLLSPHDLLVK